MKYMDCNTLNRINHRNRSIGSLIQISTKEVHLAEHIAKYNNALSSLSGTTIPHQNTQEHPDTGHDLVL